MNDLPQPLQPDAEVIAAQAAVKARGLTNGDVLRQPINDARAATYLYQTFLNEGGPEAEITEHLLPTEPPTPVRIYRPKGVSGVLPVYLHVHGGGFAIGDINTLDRWKREVAASSGAVVVGLQYALSPEYPYPTALDQVMAVLEWLRRDAATLGIDAERMGIGGDSAGGNLALAALLRLRDAHQAMPRFGAINYGMLSSNHGTPSHLELGDGRFGLSTEKLDWFWTQYLGGDASLRTNPDAAPLSAELRGLPPLLLLAAALDPLLDDTLNLDRRLSEAGIPHETKIYQGVPHGFLGQTALLEKARQAQADIVAAIGRYLA
ncbi:alpha/beta hydrolase fold domain-containing protein [Roseomonas aerophila]|uniref:Alpha/beta hydrolase fold domain-containing protein n=1 Tax=Teichococcus aerophilus TaxID=1224513 RepID=A0ABR7RFW3_9PROT|nr:alpha/beta hydrolase [Pseudoroseomonas aerophila]MBC9205444.1 alpha/beta hydrolase fold domain-containing protein [Pseudoroseomonas aerophila]